MLLNNSYKGRKIYFSKMILLVSFSKEYFIMLQVKIVTKSVIFNVHVFGYVYRSMVLTLHGTSSFNVISNYLQMEIAFKFFHFCFYSVPYKQSSFQFSYFLRDRASSLFLLSAYFRVNGPISRTKFYNSLIGNGFQDCLLDNVIVAC